jgi:glycosyltransferase involved in cell wall biosynthesis
MAAPLLTVIIPTRNRSRLLAEAIQSALPALSFPHEILVSDNASTDETARVAEKFPGLRYVRRAELMPMAEHWNQCVKEAQGKYVKILCDDDWLLPGALEREVGRLEENSSVVACASARKEVTDDGKNIVAIQGPRATEILAGSPLFSEMLWGENILGPPSSVTFRKEAFSRFPADYAYAADWAAWVLLADAGPIAFLREAGACFRLHDSNLTNRYVNEGTDFVEVMALRRECLGRLGGVSRIAGEFYYRAIFLYRLARRLTRLSTRGQAPASCLSRAFSEKRTVLKRS